MFNRGILILAWAALSVCGTTLRADHFGVLQIGMTPYDASGFVPKGIVQNQGWSSLDVGPASGYSARVRLGWCMDTDWGLGSQAYLDAGWPFGFTYDQTSGPSLTGSSGGDLSFFSYGVVTGPSYRMTLGRWRVGLAALVGVMQISDVGQFTGKNVASMNGAIGFVQNPELQFDYVGAGGFRPGISLGYIDASFTGSGPAGLDAPTVKISGIYAAARLLFGIGR